MRPAFRSLPGPGWFYAAPALALLAGAYVVPLGKIVVDSLIADHRLSLSHYVPLLQGPTFLVIVARTVRIALLTTVLTAVIGYPLAYRIHKLPPRMQSAMILLVTVPFFTSVLIRSYAWIAILGNHGLINRLLVAAGLTDQPLRLVFNEFGVLIGMVQIQLPMMVFPVLVAIKRIDPVLVRAGKTLGAGSCGAFLQLFLPLSAPGLATGCCLVLISSLGYFVTPAILGGPGEYLIAQSIDVRVSTLVDFGGASAQATILLAVVTAWMWVFRRALGLTPASGHARAPYLRLRSRWPEAAARFGRLLDNCTASLCRALSYAVAAGALALSVLPLLIVVPLAFSSAPYLAFPPPGFSLRWFQAYLSDPQWVESTLFSLEVALLSATAAVVIGFLAAVAIMRHGHTLAIAAPLYFLCLSPMIVPQMVIAVALFFSFAKLGLIGTTAGFITAYTLLGLPFVVVVLANGLRQVDVRLEQAAAVLGAPPLSVIWRVTLPLLLPAVATAYVLAFLVAFDDLVVALFLSDPGAVTLPMRMWDDIRIEINPRIAAVAVAFFGVAVSIWLVWNGGRALFMLGRIGRVRAG